MSIGIAYPKAMSYLRAIVALTFLLCHFSAFALITSDRMSTQIIKMYDKNVLVLNRGLEDGIFKGDHMKITSDEGFIARGICLKASMLLSHWKIYRVVRPELVSKDSLYTLHSLNQSSIPRDLRSFRKVDFTNFYTDISDADIERVVKRQQKRLAQYDLPDSIESAKRPKTTDNRKFVEKNFDAASFKKDFSKLELSIFASPISWESLNNQRNIYYGMSLFNYGQKYNFELYGDKRDTRTVERYSEEAVEKSRERLTATFSVKEITPSWSIFSHALYEQEQEGNITNPITQINFGPLGFTKHFISDPSAGRHLNFSFIPLYDKRIYEDLEGNTVDRSNARLGLRLFWTEALTDMTSIRADLWHSPYIDLDMQEMDFNDGRTNFKVGINRKVTDYFSLEYQLQYLNDATYSKDLDAPSENVINTINLRLTTQL
ncbi:MAG: hypothetical protein KC478_08280 [Bacteriovoracaceae bacterium]|nr:hypothetical protein [Bacteriovoracaceae bacterium]